MYGSGGDGYDDGDGYAMGARGAGPARKGFRGRMHGGPAHNRAAHFAATKMARKFGYKDTRFNQAMVGPNGTMRDADGQIVRPDVWSVGKDGKYYICEASTSGGAVYHDARRLRVMAMLGDKFGDYREIPVPMTSGWDIPRDWNP